MSAETAEPALKIEGLKKSYRSGNEIREVLKSIDLVVEKGQAVAIMGPSGSGKSTLLNILGGLETPDGGKTLIDGDDPFEMDDQALSHFRNRRVGFVFQDHYLLPQCTALENTILPSLVSDEDRSLSAQRARYLLTKVGLEERLDALPSEMSGGERQRTAIARAMINRPRLLLCDEPTGNLDRKTERNIAERFNELKKEDNAALVIVTHNAEFAACFDRRFRLEEGSLVETDS